MFANAKSLMFKNRVNSEEEILKKVNAISMSNIDYVLKEYLAKGIINAAYVGDNVDYKKLNKVIF